MLTSKEEQLFDSTLGKLQTGCADHVSSSDIEGLLDTITRLSRKVYELQLQNQSAGDNSIQTQRGGVMYE